MCWLMFASRETAGTNEGRRGFEVVRMPRERMHRNGLVSVVMVRYREVYFFRGGKQWSSSKRMLATDIVASISKRPHLIRGGLTGEAIFVP